MNTQVRGGGEAQTQTPSQVQKQEVVLVQRKKTVVPLDKSSYTRHVQTDSYSHFYFTNPLYTLHFIHVVLVPLPPFLFFHMKMQKTPKTLYKLPFLYFHLNDAGFSHPGQ